MILWTSFKSNFLHQHSNTLTLKHFLPIFILLFGYQLLAEPKERLRLIHADELENITGDDGKAIQYLTGNVKFKKGDVILTSNRAYYREKDGIGSFIEDVLMERNEQIMTVDSLVFDSQNDILMGFGHVHFEDPDYKLLSDTLTYFLESDSGIATGAVHFTQGSQIITTDNLIYKKEEGADAASYTAIGNVTIQEGERNATCGKSIYNAQLEQSLLLENPKINEAGQTISGDEIHLIYMEDILQQLIIPDHAHIVYETEGKLERISKDDSTKTIYQKVQFVDEMTGKRMEAFFKDGIIDSVRLEGMATTLYHLFSEGSSEVDSVYQGKNFATGDTITLLFEPNSIGKSELKTIHIVGGGRGEYTPDDASDNIHAPIIYRADTIHYSIPDEETQLRKTAKIDYQDVTLKSGYIEVSWEDNLLTALPLPPDVQSDDPTEFPQLLEKGKNPIVGQALVYNLDTRHGRIHHGKTQMDDGYYTGEEIRNQSEDVFYVSYSAYTTCNLDPDPHFHFESRQMKMITGDKIIVKPIVLYISGIPLFALPFGVFPDQSGRRHSGWIMPSYGKDNPRGRQLRGLGYFWAVNDHVNSTFLLDFYDKWGILFRSKNRYFKRYGYGGNLNFRYTRTVQDQDIGNIFSDPKQIKWALSWNHTQRLRYNQNFNARAEYVSNSDFNRRFGIDLGDRLDQYIISNATYSKRWPKINSSFSLNLSRKRNLMSEEKIDYTSIYYSEPNKSGMRVVQTNTVFPSLSINKSQSQLFKGTKGTNLYWNYNSKIRNNGTGFYKSKLLVSENADSDSVYIWGDLEQTYDNSWAHNISLSGTGKLFKYIALRPSINLREGWITKYFDADSADVNGNPIGKSEIREFRSRLTGSLNLNANTKLYGLFPVKIRPLISIRHTITPSVGFSYQPNFSKKFYGYDFGYFKTITDSSSTEYDFDPFSGTMIGATSRQERRSINLSVKNVFQAKILERDKERKINNLLTWNMSTSYNFAAKEFGWAKLRSTFRAKLPMKLNLDVSMTHDFYRTEKVGNTLKRVNSINKNSLGIPIPRLVSMSFSTGFRISGKQQKIISQEDVEELTQADTTDDDLTSIQLIKSQSTSQTKPVKRNIWDANVNLRYTTNRSVSTKPKDTFWMGMNLRMNPTKFWHVTYESRFDLLKRDLVSHRFHITRDLHCWVLTFTWIPSGYISGYYLRINVKSPTLKDLKLESKGGRWRTPWS
ncbi:MAG: hypothetical protein IIA61_13235 [Candidatus Marinimicrobia bacterium]|nr:hypothetical protein [Candidatus Neomarinimicrobiota bacterium]